MVLCNSYHVVHPEAVGYPVGSQDLEAVSPHAGAAKKPLLMDII